MSSRPDPGGSARRGRTIGIDLGTSNSAVAAIGADGEPVIVARAPGRSSIPSVVSFERQGNDIVTRVGDAAQRAAASADPANTLYGIKRLIGRRFDDPEVQHLARTLPYQVVPRPNGDAWVQVCGRTVPLPQVSALVLRRLADLAETTLGQPVSEAVITVPAHFDNEQRRATRDAAEIAGLEVRRLLNEPTAAALGFGAHRGQSRRLAVCDLGGGTFDVSIVSVEQGVIEVISTTGDLFLGGEDIDRIVLDRLMDEIRQDHQLDVASDPPSLERLKHECRSAKHRLSHMVRTDIDIVLGVGAGAPLEYRRSIRRDELEFWVASLLDRLEPPCLEAMARCGLAPRNIDAVLLVGGATRSPAVQRRIANLFGRQPKLVNQGQIVAIGAATLSAILDGVDQGVVLLDVTSWAIGIDAGSGKYQQVIPRNTAIPTREHKIIATTEDGQRELVVDVYEGESPALADNRLLGRFVCSGLPEAPAGEVMVMFELTVDADGLLRVSASEMGGGGRPELRLCATAGLTRAEVSRLRQSVASL